ncbi:MAG: oxygen-insensitive NAD(P)H nitroreductase [Flavobacteriaceae bacterium]|nr:MAG: oxygen-insensitive NAD(P)H nitroreductase [Flavobacteriaceae bacterium]
MDIIKTLNWRYSTKEFDTEKKISTADFEQVKALLRMSASSTNVQPWHFVIADDKKGKERMAKATQGGFQFNEKKVMDASHVILFCAKTEVDDAYMAHVLAQEDTDGRYPNEEIKVAMDGGRKFFASMHRDQLNDLQHWIEKQVYLNIGNLLLGAGMLKIDALPMEGVDLSILNEEFTLKEKGLTAVAMVSLGYRTATDFNAATPKSRLPENEIMTIL